MSIIKPTIGRKVWFWINGSHIGPEDAAQPECIDSSQAMDATVVCVWWRDHNMVNLWVVDHVGTAWPIQDVILRQEGDAKPNGMYCEWMPYQAAQAKKDEQVNTAIARTMTFGTAIASIATAETDSAIAQAKKVEELPGATTPQVVALGEAPKVTIEDIMEKIVSCTFTLLPNGRTTICQLTMQNGFTIEGDSACVSAANYKKADGEKYAYEKAIDNVWAFEGYLLAERLFNLDKMREKAGLLKTTPI